MTHPTLPPAPPNGGPRRRLRLVGAVALTALVVVFAVQNLAHVTVEFLLWEFPASIALVVLAPFLLGLVVGTTAMALRGRKARQIGGRKTTQRVLGKRDSG